VEIRHEDPSNNVGWRDLVMNNKEQIDISGKLGVSGNVDIRNNLSVGSDNFNQSQDILLAGAGGLNGTGGGQGTARSTTQHNADYVPSNAFNGSLVNNVDAWHNSAAAAGDPFVTENLDFEFPYAVHITKYKIWPRLLYNTASSNAQGPSAWTLQGSNDGANYVDIEQPRTAAANTATSTSTSITDGTGNDEYTLANATNAYKHIRLKITASQNGANNLSIGELAYYGYIDGTITTNHLMVAGNVGIGTTTPSERLEVNGNIKIERPGSGGANLTCQATGLNHHADINIVSVERANHPSENFVGGFNKIRSIGNDSEGALAFIKMNNAGTSEVKTMLKLVQNGAYFGGPVYANDLILNGAGGATSSDDRIKENEKLIVNATETLSKLTPQIYDKYQTMDLSGSSIIESGLIAQEVYYNAPELRHLVTVGKDTDASGNEYTPTPEEMDLSGVDIGSDPDYGSHGWSKQNSSSLNYSGLIAYLIKSNQELVGRIDSLKTDISAIMTHLDLQQLTQLPPTK
jgi:hypothetical protein